MCHPPCPPTHLPPPNSCVHVFCYLTGENLPSAVRAPLSHRQRGALVLRHQRRRRGRHAAGAEVFAEAGGSRAGACVVSEGGGGRMRGGGPAFTPRHPSSSSYTQRYSIHCISDILSITSPLYKSLHHTLLLLKPLATWFATHHSLLTPSLLPLHNILYTGGGPPLKDQG